MTALEDELRESIRQLESAGARAALVGGLAVSARSGLDTGIVVDLLFASSGIEPEIVAAAQPLEVVAELRVSVARTGHLIAMKLLARDDRHRPADADDLRALATVADPRSGGGRAQLSS